MGNSLPLQDLMITLATSQNAVLVTKNVLILDFTLQMEMRKISIDVLAMRDLFWTGTREAAEVMSFIKKCVSPFLDNMIRSGHRRLARSFNLCYKYIDDLIVFNNKKFLDYLKEIYPSQLTVEKANKSDHLADYLDLTFIIDSEGKLSTRLYDKRDDFDFHIVNFPFLSSNIPSGPSYGVYISQLIRYARCCSHYDDFRYRHKCLVDRLLSQGYKALRLEKSFKKFYGRYQDLIEKYRRSVNAMVSDSFPGQFLFNM